MYPIPSSEILEETRTCRQCAGEFPITDKDIEFYSKVSPIFPSGGVPTIGGGLVAPKKYQIPSPTLCPDCRQQRRLTFRNERKLYKRKCDATQKDIISIYSPDKPYTVYHQDYWWSDAWDPMDYGRDFDFSRGAMVQMDALLKVVPRNNIFINKDGSENSEYTNHTGALKNCYYTFGTWESENCIYCAASTNSTNCVDCNSLTRCENCYFSVNLKDSYQCQYCVGCESGNNLSYCYNCIGCNDCIGCSNLKNKKYCIENKQYSQEEYKVNSIKYIKSIKNPLSYITNLEKNTIFPNMKILGSENCFGDNILNSKNCCSAFDIYYNVEDSKYVTHGLDAKDVYDTYGFGADQSRAYEIVDVGVGSNDQYFSLIVHNSSFVFYSQLCFHSSHLFLCIGLQNKSYCILNKQYTKEEYEVLVPNIIEKMMADGDWGEFFPTTLSPFGYNETVASEYFSLEKEEAQKQGFNWSDYEAPFPKVEKVIPAEKLPESIESIPDDILNWAIECEISKKPFRIIRQELEFYRKHNIAIPKKHPDVRHMDRMRLRNPRKLFERKCDQCGKEMITTYAPERPETVYCEKCYNREVIS